MIRDYSDHAANERTFLAWLRTGIAVIAFGFVIEKFNLFALTLLNGTDLGEKVHAQLERYSGPFGWGAGHAFIAVGIAAILIATIRFVRTGRLLDDTAVHSPGILTDLAFGVTLALLVAALSAYPVFV
ncbi:MAG: YidH family protein [Methyloceanibacter sp.]